MGGNILTQQNKFNVVFIQIGGQRKVITLYGTKCNIFDFAACILLYLNVCNCTGSKQLCLYLFIYFFVKLLVT